MSSSTSYSAVSILAGCNNNPMKNSHSGAGGSPALDRSMSEASDQLGSMLEILENAGYNPGRTYASMSLLSLGLRMVHFQ